MTSKELVAQLNGREYGSEITYHEEKAAEAAGLLVIFGYSDDNIELRGALEDEIGCFGGGKFTLNREGILPKWDEHEEKSKQDAHEWFRQMQLPSTELSAKWDCNGYSWFITAGIDHEVFDILEEGQPFCRGIVLSLEDIR